MLARRAPARRDAPCRRASPPSSARTRCRRKPTATRPVTSTTSATMLPADRRDGLADAVDAFCEGIAFSPDETARVFAAAQAAGLPVKLHADQLSNLHGAALAGRVRRPVGRPSRIYRRGRRRRDGAGRHVAVLLPGAFYFLRETQTPADRGVAPAWRADRDRHRLQSRHLADHVAALGDEHGGDPVPHDGRGSASPA